MSPPFSSDQFFGVFAAYNQAVWPAQILFVGLAAVVIALALTRPPWQGRAIGALLALLWAWMGIAYHWAFFAAINPAARLFGAMFVLEGILLVAIPLRTPVLSFRPTPDLYGWAGGVLAAYALVLYPLLGLLLGHRYPAQPTFGLPCPTTIFTVAILAWARPRIPWSLLVIPVLWTIVGSSAVWSFGVLEDVMLPVAGIVGLTFAIVQRAGPRSARKPLEALPSEATPRSS